MVLINRHHTLSSFAVAQRLEKVAEMANLKRAASTTADSVLRPLAVFAAFLLCVCGIAAG